MALSLYFDLKLACELAYEDYTITRDKIKMIKSVRFMVPGISLNIVKFFVEGYIAGRETEEENNGK